MNGVRLPNREAVYHCFSALGSLGSRGRKMQFVPVRCKLPRLIGLDAVRYPGFGKRLAAGLSHQLDGSRATLWYKACHKPTADQIAKAQYATQVLKIPRRRYTGTLVDVFKHNGTLYALLAGVLERDRENNRHGVNFRHFNLEDGDLYAAYIEQVDAKLKTLTAVNPLGAGTKAQSKKKVP